MYFFEFKVVFYIDGKEHTELGVTYAETYTDAVSQIESWYGDDMVELRVCGLEESPVYILDGPGAEPFFCMD